MALLPGQLRTPRGQTPPDQQRQRPACRATGPHCTGTVPGICCGRLGATSEPGGVADEPSTCSGTDQTWGAAAPSVHSSVSKVLPVARNSPVGQGQELGGQGAH